MLYAALGDSITYGYAASSKEASWVHRFAKALARNRKVNLYLHAKPGWTSRQLAKSLDKVPECIFAEAKVVTIMVGGNDLLRSAPWLVSGHRTNAYQVAERVQENLEKIVERVKHPGATILIATLYNPFPNSLLAEEYTDTVNRCIRKVADRHGLGLADVRQVFQSREAEWIDGYRRGQLKDLRIIGNPIHPNDAGHAAIARVFVRAYRQSVQLPSKSRRRA